MSAGRIMVSYAGVHQAYQMAMAAQEMGELAAFYCSLYDAPGTWGARLGRFVGTDFFDGRLVDGLDLGNVREVPWPLAWKAVRDRLYPRRRGNWLSTNGMFDRRVARAVRTSPPEIFVGTASSDLHCLKAARNEGSTLIHDCPGLHPGFEHRLLAEAADRAGVRGPARVRTGGMMARKLEEYALADVLTLSSDVQSRGFEEAGFPPDRLFVTPLWADPALWFAPASGRRSVSPRDRPLKLLFVGSVSLRKGIPFLMQAIDLCEGAAELTTVGPKSAGAANLLGSGRDRVRWLDAQPKSQLRKTYQDHDVLVLPSVCDAFGFVALEAMACGTPAIVTEMCGAPVPDADWRIPAMDPSTLAQRIMFYADDRDLAGQHGHQASKFASQYGPDRYRERIRLLFGTILRGERPTETSVASHPERVSAPMT